MTPITLRAILRQREEARRAANEQRICRPAGRNCD